MIAQNRLSPPPTPLYFINGPVDFALIGLASVGTFLAFYLAGQPQSNDAILQASWLLLFICNWPHFSASNYRLYHDRANIRQYPVTALVVPWVVLAGVVGCVLSPEVVTPYFFKLYLIWSSYHFSGQTFGITLIYARRAGFRLSRWARTGLSTFIFGTFISQTLRSEVPGATVAPFYGVSYPPFGVPAWAVDVSVGIMWLGGLVFLAYAAWWSWRQRRLLPAIVLVPAATQYVWFVQSSYYASFQAFVPFFHSLQYLLIAWSMQLKSKMDRDHIAPSVGYVVRETARWGAINIVGGAVLFLGLPYVLYLASPSLTLTLATGIVVAAIQVHHFFVDGVIWKLKSASVASPLMMNVEDLIHSHPVPAAVAPARVPALAGGRA